MTPEEIEKMKRQIAMLGSLEQDGTDISRMSLEQADEPQVAAPHRRVIVPRAASQEARVPTSAPLDPDAELTAARGGDIDAFNDRATEMALRQMVAGITRTKAPDSTVNQLGTGEKDLLGRRRQSQLDALREMEAGNNSERTKAYRDSVAAGSERADKKLAADADEGGKRDARAQAVQALRESEAAERARHNQAMEKKKTGKAPGPAALADEVPFGDTTFQYQGDPNISKELKLAGAKHVREKAGQWNTTLNGLSALESALGQFIKSPTPQNRALLYGPALTAAGSTNAAIGQGAMSIDEKNAQFQALGVNMGDAAGIEALVERAFNDPKATEDMLRRVRQMKDLAKSSVTAAAQPYSYRQKGAATPSAAPSVGSSLSAEDEKALAWAKAHPDDPDAKAILQLHGDK